MVRHLCPESPGWLDKDCFSGFGRRCRPSIYTPAYSRGSPISPPPTKRPPPQSRSPPPRENEKRAGVRCSIIHNLRYTPRFTKARQYEHTLETGFQVFNFTPPYLPCKDPDCNITNVFPVIPFPSPLLAALSNRLDNG